MYRPASSGFTLVELLVVIAIICILASILYPVFAKARGKGRQASCISNLKQIGVALHLYADDHDEMFPLDADFGPACFWYERLDPYIKNRAVGLCLEQGTVSRTMPTFDHPYLWTYALSRVMCRLDMSLGFDPLFDLARIQHRWDVSRMFMVGEAIREGIAPNFFITEWWPYGEYHDFLHNDRSDVLFVDGHVKALGPGSIFDAYPGVLQ